MFANWVWWLHDTSGSRCAPNSNTHTHTRGHSASSASECVALFLAFLKMLLHCCVGTHWCGCCDNKLAEMLQLWIFATFFLGGFWVPHFWYYAERAGQWHHCSFFMDIAVAIQNVSRPHFRGKVWGLWGEGLIWPADMRDKFMNRIFRSLLAFIWWNKIKLQNGMYFCGKWVFLVAISTSNV